MAAKTFNLQLIKGLDYATKHVSRTTLNFLNVTKASDGGGEFTSNILTSNHYLVPMAEERANLQR